MGSEGVMAKNRQGKGDGHYRALSGQLLSPVGELWEMAESTYLTVMSPESKVAGVFIHRLPRVQAEGCWG